MRERRDEGRRSRNVTDLVYSSLIALKDDGRKDEGQRVRTDSILVSSETHRYTDGWMYTDQVCVCVCVLTAGRLGRVTSLSSLVSWEESVEPSVLAAELPEHSEGLKHQR